MVAKNEHGARERNTSLTAGNGELLKWKTPFVSSLGINGNFADQEAKARVAEQEVFICIPRVIHKRMDKYLPLSSSER